ncbi:hypothetical protein KEM60_02924 [Austwickia sp. TVS 96-490-7B]|uniref:hypothetical protein n=1 Tax=Austwickia sp. TVS 96-490-7B TaxID=2830843 RepID=UPI001C58AEAE|nr:hypothetical protein [Austwickia sp. TVS 96-490-7B]MBW3086695.1 hypothetical protein [Austwickia sp. TVS 96-490-7B]
MNKIQGDGTPMRLWAFLKEFSWYAIAALPFCALFVISLHAAIAKLQYQANIIAAWSLMVVIFITLNALHELYPTTSEVYTARRSGCKVVVIPGYPRLWGWLLAGIFIPPGVALCISAHRESAIPGFLIGSLFWGAGLIPVTKLWNGWGDYILSEDSLVVQYKFTETIIPWDALDQVVDSRGWLSLSVSPGVMLRRRVRILLGMQLRTPYRNRSYDVELPMTSSFEGKSQLHKEFVGRVVHYYFENAEARARLGTKESLAEIAAAPPVPIPQWVIDASDADGE